ncbi:MAG: glutathione S-transferase C-terminal domain-containing protein [Halofilum sp. (in: g-proteobacteria)]|nr:glutathione S-transferase C-terminal domain-containing protein [Halofilum sp. (in: g-proteobacteria)]
MLVDGQWQGKFQPVQDRDDQGGFVRQPSQFRRWIGDDGLPPQPRRYRLYVALTCPWASRVLAVRRLKGLEEVIPLTIVAPALTDQGWAFDDFPGSSGSDPEHGARYLHELYSHADPSYTGRATVPLLWDTAEHTAVNNESADLVRMLNSAFDELLPPERAAVDLRPEGLREAIDELNEWMYPRVNNGVYRCGFATTQAAHDEAVSTLFDALDSLEDRLLNEGPYLHGEVLTESDIRLFVTLIRFDVAYHGLFKTNLRQIRDYPALAAHTGRLYEHPDIRPTVDFDHIRHGYYSIKALNPTRIVPRGPKAILHGIMVDG